MHGPAQRATLTFVCEAGGPVPGGAMTTEGKLETFFRGHPFFADLPAEVIGDLSQYASLITAEPDEVLFDEGDPGNHLYWIVDGSVRFTTVGRSGRMATLNILETGAMFGEIALLDDGPRTATARAMTPGLLIVVARDQMYAYLRRQPEFALAFIRLLCDRLRYVSSYVQSAK